jgi:hypothetical protein
MDNVTLLPHVGTETSDTQRKVSSVYGARIAPNRTIPVQYPHLTRALDGTPRFGQPDLRRDWQGADQPRSGAAKESRSPRLDEPP